MSYFVHGPQALRCRVCLPTAKAEIFLFAPGVLTGSQADSIGGQ